MSSLSVIDKTVLEGIFQMSGGYVLEFSNSSFQRFVLDSIKVDIYHDRYSFIGDSKANRLRALWQLGSDAQVGKLTEDLVQYIRTVYSDLTKGNIEALEKGVQISYKLQGKTPTHTSAKNDEQLRINIEEVPISKLKIDSRIIPVLEQRILEVKKCMEAGAPLSIIFLCGSVLEGILLSIAISNPKEFNQCNASPRDKDSGDVKKFHEWSLSSFIDVAYILGYIGLDIKKHSHSLRDFRNYIHPHEQFYSNFNPDLHTAQISWHVLKAAIHDIYSKK